MGAARVCARVLRAERVADFQYKCTDFYFPADEGGLLWNDPDVGIPWPITEPQLSAKDIDNPRLRDLKPT